VFLKATCAAVLAAQALALLAAAQEGERKEVRPGAMAARDRTLAIATKAFEGFKEGLATGRFERFFDMLSDDFSFYFPTGKWHGQWTGKPKAIEFFGYVRSVYPEGLQLTLDRVTCNDTTCTFEFRDWGRLVIPGQPPRDYKNRVAVSLDVKDDKIVGYREYFGSDGSSF
jgi:ketosteroid isomerase-like protein